MGLASSQARLLNLTARMHQIEYKAERLEAMKLQMANESRKVYDDYLVALDKTKVQMKTLTDDGSVTFRDITNYGDFISAGYALVYNNTVYDNKEYYTDGNGHKFDNKTDFVKVTATNQVTYPGAAVNQYAKIDVFGNTITSDTKPTISTAKQKFDMNQLVKDIVNDHGNNPITSVNITDAAAFETALTNVINSGWVTILAADREENNKFYDPSSDPLKFADFETSIAINTGLQEITDEIALRKAEAKYEADMKTIDQKDRKYDTDLAALDAERNAIKQEMETLKTVSKDNVERTFKLFS